ncbi:glycosyltransferase family 4 protein [Streptacidiphilus rugosus]|uniref:glycosyltransferase family 4 protein n=1 Tax=Streptacidiphilus rugosus TaxID=405783 RepID=UPI0005664CD5
MLVDNGVHGDSRVQKTARSAAEAGWEVTLLGRSYTGETQTWKIGEADVRLIHMPTPLGMQRHWFRRSWLRRPLAYPPYHVAQYRTQQVKAWRADLAVRLAELSPNAKKAKSPAGRALGKAALVPPRLAAQVAYRWVRLRAGETRRMKESRKNTDTRLDQLWARVLVKARGNRAWRQLDPQLWDYELAFGPVIDSLKPELIHANDFRMLGVGARSTIRQRATGRDVKLVWDAHEYLPGVRPYTDNARWRPANVHHEREYSPYADAVITVSDTLADMLQESHALPEKPAVVLNAPGGEAPEDVSDEAVPDIRELCGIGADVPLMVYSGAAAPQRGLDIMVEALPELPGVHTALVVLDPKSAYLRSLVAKAEELGVSDRVHVMGYVPHYQVVPFLSGATVGVIPIHHWPNHEIALITKYFEYSHARLPLVVSDVKTMSEVAERTGQGEIFKAEDLNDFLRAVRAVLADPERYAKVYDQPGLLEQWTWEHQATVLDEVYSRVVSAPRGTIGTRS